MPFLEAYTELAFSLLGGRLPEVVYLPPSLRTRPTVNPPELPAGDHLSRIIAADPIGFLVAIVQGKSIVSLSVKNSEELGSPAAARKRGRPKQQSASARIKLAEENGLAMYADFHSPSTADRERVAMFLVKSAAHHQTPAGSPVGDGDFAALCEKRAAQHATQNGGMGAG